MSYDSGSNYRYPKQGQKKPSEETPKSVDILINALRDIELYSDVADPAFTPKQFGEIARKALKEYGFYPSK